MIFWRSNLYFYLERWSATSEFILQLTVFWLTIILFVIHVSELLLKLSIFIIIYSLKMIQHLYTIMIWFSDLVNYNYNNTNITNNEYSKTAETDPNEMGSSTPNQLSHNQTKQFYHAQVDSSQNAYNNAEVGQLLMN